MAKKNKNFSSENFGKETVNIAEDTQHSPQHFYFGRENYKWMIIGLGLIILGFLLMLGRDANTRPDGTFDPNYWNEGIFSVIRIRIAPLLVVLGFAVESYAILLKNKFKSEK